MNNTATRLFATVAVLLGVCIAEATSLVETIYARHRFEALADAGRSKQVEPAAAFQFLKLVAQNKRGQVDAETLSRVAFDSTELLTGYFGAVGVRVEAFRALGFLATEEARRFLGERSQAELPPDEADELWPVIRIAV